MPPKLLIYFVFSVADDFIFMRHADMPFFDFSISYPLESSPFYFLLSITSVILFLFTVIIIAQRLAKSSILLYNKITFCCADSTKGDAR